MRRLVAALVWLLCAFRMAGSRPGKRLFTSSQRATETEGLHSAGIKGSDFEKQMVSLTPLGRIGQPEDIARVAVFLASEESNWLTGERISASGGWH